MLAVFVAPPFFGSSLSTRPFIRALAYGFLLFTRTDAPLEADDPMVAGRIAQWRCSPEETILRRRLRAAPVAWAAWDNSSTRPGASQDDKDAAKERLRTPDPNRLTGTRKTKIAQDDVVGRGGGGGGGGGGGEGLPGGTMVVDFGRQRVLGEDDSSSIASSSVISSGERQHSSSAASIASAASWKKWRKNTTHSRTSNQRARGRVSGNAAGVGALRPVRHARGGRRAGRGAAAALGRASGPGRGRALGG